MASLFALAIVAMIREGDSIAAGKVGMITAMLCSIGASLVRRKT